MKDVDKISDIKFLNDNIGNDSGEYEPNIKEANKILVQRNFSTGVYEEIITGKQFITLKINHYGNQFNDYDCIHEYSYIEKPIFVIKESKYNDIKIADLDTIKKYIQEHPNSNDYLKKLNNLEKTAYDNLIVLREMIQKQINEREQKEREYQKQKEEKANILRKLKSNRPVIK